MQTVRVVGALGVLVCLGGAAVGQAPKAGKPKAVALTIYNQNFALVKERRSIDLAAGRNSVVVADVARLIDPTTVGFRSLTAPGSVVVREQNYQYDLMSYTSILNKSVGQTVTVDQTSPQGATVRIVGTLMAPVNSPSYDYYGSPSSTYQGVILKLADGRIVLNPTGTMAVEHMPEGLTPTPQLLWQMESTKGGSHDCEISYITDGMNWKADYVATLAADERSVDITGWVTLDNKSGATYENADLQLIAGDVRRTSPRPQRQTGGGFGGGGGGYAARPEPQFQQQSFFEYHLYTLNGTTTVRDNEEKQMTLLTAERAPATKKFVYDGRRSYYLNAAADYRPGDSYDRSTQKKVNVVMEVANRRPALGLPLPKGHVRLYKADSRGSLQFIGEDTIDHTPRDETLSLYIGESFDAVGEHQRTNYRRIAWNEVEETFQIALRNHRQTDMKVSVIEHLWADWAVTEKSQDYVKKDAHTIEFVVPVPKDGEAKVTYTVRTRW